MNERSVTTKLIDEKGHSQDTILYVRFRENETVHLILAGKSLYFESDEATYVQSLLELITKLPEGYQLKFLNSVQSTNGNSVEILTVEEYTSVTRQYDPDEPQLKYRLVCNYRGITFEAEAIEDFSIALQALQDKMDVSFNICAFCSNGDFRSTGGEDLRQGWYCLRDVLNRQPDLPWFQREQEFQEAYSNVNAFHWCPCYVKAVDRMF
ncbi:hypothetical protein ABER61_22500 [Brevibacillus formosus]|uniref:Uncharacterized protein n=1 Tax=Brevibacillus formosus TaxID=54913 RepID=A0A837KD85_9BACL|nr:hypothetical protein [Brevibacillus formosus]KLH95817.1 hypothetical protein AA984_28775 [Brevibacillus formosus]KLH98688.1 hypothetical protein AA984_17010 [Brevibacillus formosus]MED1958014.1 hypothetical protein [Brevibacillus formosus]PSJ94154.1 hypothetical protein C7R91_19290 [Brevibacillus formosus]GED61017.1 hypothetical protein BFO01nite_51490 [Brevibacillus formosus]